ncbi:MAG: hypothetical protein ABJ327_24520 [Litoreibacter sp.]
MRPRKSYLAGQVALLSTDLRDGSQTPGVHFSLTARISIAKALADIGIDVIEAGFPISCNLHNQAVRDIVEHVGKRSNAPTIVSFARTGRFDANGYFITDDIDVAWDAVRAAQFPRIHIVGSGSDLHLCEKYRSEGPFGRSRATNIEVVSRSITHASELMRRDGFEPEVQFSPEDCGRADLSYLVGLFAAAARAGANVLNVPDTVGRMRPDQYRRLIADLIALVPESEGIIWSTHAHDDLGLATANTLAGVEAGARQVEGTFMGLGERAGNACLEQIATILGLYGEMDLECHTALRLNRLPKLTRLIADWARIPIPAAAPIIGKNAFRHKSGMHQDGIIKKPEVYQDIPPSLVGRDITLELGPDSGWAGIAYCAQRLGYDVPSRAKPRVLQAFQLLSERIGLVEDADLEALLIAELDAPIPAAKQQHSA